MTENFLGITDTGRMRDNNEDSFIAQKVLKDQFIAACVIDGVGGYEGGEIAARIAHDAIVDYLKIPSGSVLTMMKEAVSVANEKIYAEKIHSGQYEQMACVLTLALADIKNNVFHYVHVGDTRLYLLRDNTLIKITKDHSFVGYLEDSGRLSEEEAMQHPKRNEINKALGFDARFTAEDYVDAGTSPFLPGDLLLLCSDGLTDMINNQTITSILTSGNTLAAKAQKLIAAANEAGGKDNITTVLVYNDKKPVKQKALKPVIAAKENEPEMPVQTGNTNKEDIIMDRYTEQPKEKGSGAIIVLSLLCLLFLGGFLWQLMKEKDVETGPDTVVSVQRTRNEGEQKLLDHIPGVEGNILMLYDSVYGRNIVVTDTIHIESDSLILAGSGQIIQCDSMYTGPAIVVSADTRYLLLENLTLKDFDIGLLAQNNVVHLKNIRFINCRLPVQYGFHFNDDEYVNGVIADSLFLESDSLPK